MNETLRLIDQAIEALRRSHPGHIMLYELEECRSLLVRYARVQGRTPAMFAEYRQ